MHGEIRIQEESIKTFAMRPALEWALLKLHDSDTSLVAGLQTVSENHMRDAGRLDISLVFLLHCPSPEQLFQPC